MGRRAWGNTAPRWTKCVTFHLTPDERKALAATADNLGISVSDYMRRLLDGQPVIARGTQTELRKVNTAIETVGRMVNQWGSNFNQALKHANETRKLGGPGVEIAARLDAHLSDIAADRVKALDMLGELQLLVMHLRGAS